MQWYLHTVKSQFSDVWTRIELFAPSFTQITSRLFGQLHGKIFVIAALIMVTGSLSFAADLPSKKSKILSNSCYAPSTHFCSGCQVSCPDNRQAYCKPGYDLPIDCDKFHATVQQKLFALVDSFSPFPSLINSISIGIEHMPPVDWSGPIEGQRRERRIAPRTRGDMLLTLRHHAHELLGQPLRQDGPELWAPAARIAGVFIWAWSAA